MYGTIKTIMHEARDRRRKAKRHREITLKLDALALTEIGYPRKNVDRRKRHWPSNL